MHAVVRYTTERSCVPSTEFPPPLTYCKTIAQYHKRVPTLTQSRFLTDVEIQNGSFFFFLIIIIFGCVGSAFLYEGFLQLRRAGATLHRGARASDYRGLSCCGTRAPDTQAQQLWLTGLVAPRHEGSSQTRARTRVPCIGRRTPNHCTTREAPEWFFIPAS